MLSFTKNAAQLQQRFNINHLVHIFRKNSFTFSEKRTQYEQKFMRKVLKNTSGCVLYRPDKHSEDTISPETFSEKNHVVSIVKDAIHECRYKRMHRASLDKQCLENYKTWSVNEQLLALDTCFSLKNMSTLSFFHDALGDFLQNFNELPNGPALQTMYYVASLKRKFNSNEELIVIDKLQKIITQLTLDELAIYCLALTKSESKMHNSDLLKSFFNCLMTTDLKNHEEIGVTGILKAIRRFSTSTDHFAELKELQKKLVPFAEEANVKSLANIIQLGCKQRIFNEDLVNAVIKRFSNNLVKLRIKDVERVLLSMSTFNQRSKNPTENGFVDEVQKNLLMSLDTKHPSSIIRCVSYLAILGVADERLVHWALSSNTHSITYGETISTDEHPLLIIDSYAKINLAKTYRGHTLSEELIAELMPKVVINKTSTISAKIAHEINNFFMTNGIHCTLLRPIPYDAFPEIVFVYNKQTHRTMDLRPEANASNGTIVAASSLHKNIPDLEAVAVIPCFQRQTVKYSNCYTGLYKFKLNQLTALGYKVIVIKDSIWNYYNTSTAKRKYLALELYRNDVLFLNNIYRFNFKAR